MCGPKGERSEFRLWRIPVFRREDLTRLAFAGTVLLTTLLAAGCVPFPFFYDTTDLFERLQFPAALAAFALGYGIIVPYIIGWALFRLYFFAIWKSWLFELHWAWYVIVPPVFLLASGTLLLLVSTMLPWKNKEYRLIQGSWRPLTAWLFSLALMLAISYFEPCAMVYFSGTHANLLFMCIAIAAGVEISTVLWGCGMRRTAIANCLFWCSETWLLVTNAGNGMWGAGFFHVVRS